MQDEMHHLSYPPLPLSHKCRRFAYYGFHISMPKSTWLTLSPTPKEYLKISLNCTKDITRKIYTGNRVMGTTIKGWEIK